jgi:hypothetical protein
MLLAILYRDEQILAASWACDQYAYGNEYWETMHPVDLPTNAFESGSTEFYETSYVSVSNLQLRERLMRASIDDSINLADLTADLENSLRPSYLTNRAA